MMLRKTAIVLVLLTIPRAAISQEIGFVEKFALADDRGAVLRDLIPGTDEYYYYQCLHAQNTQRYADVEGLLKTWITRHGETARAQQIMYRQSVLTYADNPAKSLQFIQSKLNLRFDHQPRRPGQSPRLPTELDQARISRDVYFNRAIQNRRNLDGFQDSMLAELIQSDDLSPEQQHALLSRIQRPDYDGLVELLKRDKKAFGTYPVHAQLLPNQLEELLKADPSLLNNNALIDAYLANLQPGPEVDWLNDAEAREAHLLRLRRFVRRLSPSQNSLKAHVLYHLLVTKEQLGEYDRQLFIEYLQLPRRSVVINEDYSRQLAKSQPLAALDADYRQSTRFVPVGNDEPLIRSYLAHFFVEAADYQEFARYLKEEFVQRVFAETKIVNGLGDLEKLSAMLPPASFKQLRERVDIEFAPTARRIFGRDEPVALDVTIKNVEKLIVKIYQINALNYYRSESRELSTDLELDGLTANWQHTFEYNEPPFRRVERHFDLPELADAGVYVVDFIGNGRSSRALIRKGQLTAVSRPTAAGQAITVFDENREVVEGAKIVLGSQEFATGENGYVLLPYTTQVQNKPIVLHADGVASLQTIAHQAETYDLSAGFYVDRESLLRREKAKVLIRPLLTVNGARVSVKALSEVRLQVTTTDLQGISSTRTIEKFVLSDEEDAVHELRTAAHLRSLSLTLSAKIRQMTTGKDLELVSSASFDVNGVRSTKRTMNGLLTRTAGIYAIDLLGLTGEPLGDLPLQLTLYHRNYRQGVQASLKTAANGRVLLGPLSGIHRVDARLPDNTTRTWNLRHVAYRYPATLHALQGERIDLPYLGTRQEAERADFSLLEIRGNRFVADHFDKLKVVGGRVEIQGLPAGDYRLKVLEQGREITLRVTKGAAKQAYLVGPQRMLDADRTVPMFIEGVEIGDNEIKVQVVHRDEATRLHVIGTQYISADTPFDRLARTPFKELGWVRPARHLTSYAEGRDIGDELRYILDRQYLTKFPGNLLDPPSLLVNPWAVRSTQTGTQDAAGGEAFDAESDAKRDAGAPASAASSAGRQGQASVYLDFLPQSATIMLDVELDENGVATIPRDALDGKHLVHLVALDHQWTDYRRLDLQESEWTPVDLRLDESFDLDKHLAQQRRVHALRGDEKLTLSEEATSRLQVFDSLSDVYMLYQTLLPQSHLTQFQFLAQWHTLSQEQKDQFYKKHACHELHLFLSRRDPAFFQAAVLPLIASKKEKQFIDRYLLGEDLARYLDPWHFQRLNVLERALLARRHPNQVEATRKHFADLLEKFPVDRQRADRLIQTVLGLDSGVSYDALATKQLKELSKPRGGAANGIRGETVTELAPGGGMGGGLGGGGRADDGAARPGGGGGFGRGMFGLAGKAAEPTSRARRKSNANRALGRQLAELEDLQQSLLFRQADKTMEWAESQYYRIENVQTAASLVSINRFWADVVDHGMDDRELFLSPHFAESARTFTEAAAALALLDLPLQGDEVELEFTDGQIVAQNRTPALIVYEASAEAEVSSEIPVLASQRFYLDTPEFQQRNAKHDHEYVSDEFLTGSVYGCQIVITNPTAQSRELDVLIQIPQGAIPIGDARATRTIPLNVPAFQTKIIQYSFYFPILGDFTHYPVHVAHEEKIVAFTDAAEFHVVEEPSKFNTESWGYVAQRGSDEEVLEFLRQRSLKNVNLEDILYRLKNREFYEELLLVLMDRHVYDENVWSYAVLHRDTAQIATYLAGVDNFVNRCGPTLDSEILMIDPIVRGTYQHLEYRPLINARTHQLGRTRKILNDRLYAQYHHFLDILSHRNTISDTERLALVYYLSAQGRTGEALEQFGRISADNVEMKIQYDYLAAYLDFFAEDPQRARDIVAKYQDFPIQHWDEAFAAIRTQLDELDGDGPGIANRDDREQQQTLQASTEPIVSLRNQGNVVTLTSANVEEVTLNYYAMDIEVLFSRNPFVQQYSNKFSFIRPNASDTIATASENAEVTISIPDALKRKNVLIEARAAGKTSTTTVLANRLDVNVSENYGQIRVFDDESNRPLSTVYVKVYARHKDGTVHFYKDGYTDLRGRFDYATLSTNQLDQTQRFSILVLSEEHGAVIQEVNPPAR